LAWYLFLLVAAGIIVFVVWSSRKQIAAREAASKARLERMLRAPVQPVAQAEPAPTAAAASPSAPSASLAVPAPAKAPAAVPVRVRFLGQAETLLYYLLKTGFPDYEVFANVSLASVISASGSGHEREQQLRRLAQYRLDFVVCDKSMRILAVVEMDSAVAAVGAGEQQFKADCLKRAGIRLVRVNPAALPKREQIRALVGGPAPAGSAGG
jgi:intracellular sulfur oxidation DsrE/DsrF family protein